MPFAIQLARFFVLSLGLAALGVSAIPQAATSDISTTSTFSTTSSISAASGVSTTSGISTASGSSAAPVASTTSGISTGSGNPFPSAPAPPAPSGVSSPKDCFKSGGAGKQEEIQSLIDRYCARQKNNTPECLTSSTGLRWQIQTCRTSEYWVCVGRLTRVLNSCVESPAGTSTTWGGWEIVNGCGTAIIADDGTRC